MQVIRLLLCMPWSQAWGFRYHWDAPVRAHTTPARLLLGSSVAHELFYRLGGFDRIFVLPDPDGEPASPGELSVGVAVATGDAAKLQTPPVDVGLGEVAVLGAGVPEAPIDEHGDPRAAQQYVDAPTPVPARHGPVDDEPQAASVQGAAQRDLRPSAGSPGPTHHPRSHGR
jgi:hypothetical protein